MVSRILNTLGLSKTQLAEILDLTRQAIYGWLKGSEPSTTHFERVSRLARLVEEASHDSNRPLYPGFVFSPTLEGRASLFALLQQAPWDLVALRSALIDARRLTSERDQRAALEQRQLESLRRIREDEQLQNLDDNLLALE
jgi:transcriptional regulator with XRE-family HTH domain